MLSNKCPNELATLISGAVFALTGHKVETKAWRRLKRLNGEETGKLAPQGDNKCIFLGYM